MSDFQLETVLVKNDETQPVDDECRCCHTVRCCQKSWFCCCCCKIRFIHIPDLVCLILLLALAFGQIPFGVATFWAVSMTRNIFAGFFFVLILIVYLPLLVGSTVYLRKIRKPGQRHAGCCCKLWLATSNHIVGQPERQCIWGRFRNIFNVLVLVALLLLLVLPYLVLLPAASTLSDDLEASFGKHEQPERASPTALSFGSWAFEGLAAWGDYGTHAAPDRFQVKTFTYKSGIAQHAGYKCGSSSRPWKSYLELDVHFPSSSNGRPPPIIFHIHGGSWTLGDKSQSAW